MLWFNADFISIRVVADHTFYLWIASPKTFILVFCGIKFSSLKKHCTSTLLYIESNWHGKLFFGAIKRCMDFLCFRLINYLSGKRCWFVSVRPVSFERYSNTMANSQQCRIILRLRRKLRNLKLMLMFIIPIFTSEVLITVGEKRKLKRYKILREIVIRCNDVLYANWKHPTCVVFIDLDWKPFCAVFPRRHWLFFKPCTLLTYTTRKKNKIGPWKDIWFQEDENFRPSVKWKKKSICQVIYGLFPGKLVITDTE